MRPPDSWESARLTIIISAITAFAWVALLVSGFQDWAIAQGSFVPARLDTGGSAAVIAAIVTPVTATLIHGSWFHLLFNLIILLFCGRAVESILGARGLAILYAVGLYAAAGAQYMAGPHSELPVVGASGAISAVIGAYAMMFGRSRVKVENQRLARLLHAAWLAAAWVIFNLMMGWTFRIVSAEPGLAGVDIAVASHIGGFLAGMALQKPLLLLKWRGA